MPEVKGALSPDAADMLTAYSTEQGACSLLCSPADRHITASSNQFPIVPKVCALLTPCRGSFSLELSYSRSQLWAFALGAALFLWALLQAPQRAPLHSLWQLC